MWQYVPVLSALRRGPAGCEFKDSQLRPQGPTSETRDGGMGRRREGQREAAMRLSFDFWEMSLFQQEVNSLTHGKLVPKKKKSRTEELTFSLSLLSLSCQRMTGVTRKVTSTCYPGV